MAEKTTSLNKARVTFRRDQAYVCRRLVDAGIEVDDDIDGGDKDLGGDEDDDFTALVLANPAHLIVPERGRLTNPLQILAMPRPHLILQHRQQIPQHLQPLRQQSHPLIHLQITPHRPIHGFQLRFRPHELRAVEHGALQVDVDAEDEELTDLLRDLRSTECDTTRQRQLRGQRMRRGDGGGQVLFEEGGFDALTQGMGDGEFGHVVLLLPQADEIVVDARLVFPRVVEVEVFRLHVPGRQLLALEAGDVVQEALLLRKSHAPDDDGAVVVEEDFGGVDADVEVGRVLMVFLVGVVVGWNGRNDGILIGDWVGAGVEGSVAGCSVEIEKFLAAVLSCLFYFNCAVRVAALLLRTVDRGGIQDVGVELVGR